MSYCIYNRVYYSWKHYDSKTDEQNIKLST